MAKRRIREKRQATVEEILDSSMPEDRPFYPMVRGGEAGGTYVDGSHMMIPPPQTMSKVDKKIQKRIKDNAKED